MTLRSGSYTIIVMSPIGVVEDGFVNSDILNQKKDQSSRRLFTLIVSASNKTHSEGLSSLLLNAELNSQSKLLRVKTDGKIMSRIEPSIDLVPRLKSSQI